MLFKVSYSFPLRRYRKRWEAVVLRLRFSSATLDAA